MKITHKLAKLPGTSLLRTIIMVTCTTPFLWLLFTNDFITLINIFPLMMMSGMLMLVAYYTIGLNVYSVLIPALNLP